MLKHRAGFLILIILVLLFTFVISNINNTEEIILFPENLSVKDFSPVELIPVSERNAYDWILLGARSEVKNKTMYDDSYYAISYPGGDVDLDRGACSDVIIRALRNAGYDLQELIHNDMRDNFSVYPQNWGLSRPDPNIDHRRVANQMVYFSRHGTELTLSTETDDIDKWQHGDIVCWMFADGRLHTGIVSDRNNAAGLPLAIHNAGVAREEDCLERWEIIGHYRFPSESN